MLEHAQVCRHVAHIQQTQTYEKQEEPVKIASWIPIAFENHCTKDLQQVRFILRKYLDSLYFSITQPEKQIQYKARALVDNVAK